MKNVQITLVALLRFCFKIIASKKLIFEGFFLSLKEPLVATLSETSAVTSRKCVVERGRNIIK